MVTPIQSLRTMAGNSEDENVPLAAVLSQCNDIFAIQNSLITKLRTQVELKITLNSLSERFFKGKEDEK